MMRVRRHDGGAVRRCPWASACVAAMALLALCLMCGCAGLPADRQTGAEAVPWQPTLVVEYYPYPVWEPEEAVQDIRPVPAYKGWTDERMRRDLERLVDVGTDVIMAVVRPQALGRAEVSQRFRRFYELAAEASPDLRITIALYIDGDLSIPFDNLAGFLRQQGLLRHGAAWRPTVDGLPVLVCPEGLRLDREGGDDLKIWRFGRELPVRPQTLEHPGVVSEWNGFAWVRAGDSGGCDHGASQNWQRAWVAPRQGGLVLASQMTEARRMGCSSVILASWNRFTDGSFVEPNSFDGEKVMETVKRFMASPSPDSQDSAENGQD